MKKLIKIFVIALLCSSCSTIYSNLGNIPLNFINAGESNITIYYKNGAPDIVNFSKDNNQYRIKTKIDQKDQDLITFNQNKLLIKQGKLINTYILNKNNYYIINYKDSHNFLDLDTIKKSALIRFTNPSTHFMEINFRYHITTESIKGFSNNQSSNNLKVVEEYFEVPQIRWRGTNYYLVDLNGEIQKSLHTLAPTL